MRNTRGFTLIEALMVVSLVGILAAISLVPTRDSLDQARYDETLNHMKQIRTALVGEMSAISTKSRFGYLGDIGALPTITQGLAALLETPTGISSWRTYTQFRINSGWNGPYLFDHFSGEADPSRDAWGTAYVYDPDSDPATVISLGADRATGGTDLNSDITLTIPVNRQQYFVNGLVLDHGNPWSGSLEVEINSPDPASGEIGSRSYTILREDQGAFQFNRVPPGIRSLTFFLPSKASARVTYGPYIITVDQPHTLAVFGTADHPLDLRAAR
ncbi:MAG: type II secretion system protein GspG [Bdellovibrionales bacterium]|nr:type II secretion system protein GspG [Bdellovibrionales bacterium]